MHVVQCFIEIWFTRNDVPEIVVVGKGGEFEYTFAQEREEFGNDVRITVFHAGWQQSQVERRCGLLSESWRKVV